MERTTERPAEESVGAALPDDAALLVVDVQDGLDDPYWGQRNNPGAEENMARLLAAWRRTGRPIFHVQHLSRRPTSPLRPGQPGVEIKAVVAPRGDEPVVQKDVNSAFIGTDLEARLRDRGVGTVVIAGLTTDHCVSSTASVASNLGFETYVVADATAAFDGVGYDGRRFPAEVIHAVSLANLHGEFATVVDTDDLLRRLG